MAFASDKQKTCPGRQPVDRNFPKAFGDGNWRKKMAADIEKTVKDLNSYSVLEIAKLVKKLEENWGVSAAAPVAVATKHPAGRGGATAGCSERTFAGLSAGNGGEQKNAIKRKIGAVT